MGLLRLGFFFFFPSPLSPCLQALLILFDSHVDCHGLYISVVFCILEYMCLLDSVIFLGLGTIKTMGYSPLIEPEKCSTEIYIG